MQKLQKKLYILTDKSLEPIYAAVQGSHAVAKYLIDFPDNEWKNSTLVYLKCDVELWKHKLNIQDISYSEWKEPDLNHMTTALACFNEGKVFRKLRTL